MNTHSSCGYPYLDLICGSIKPSLHNRNKKHFHYRYYSDMNNIETKKNFRTRDCLNEATAGGHLVQEGGIGTGTKAHAEEPPFQ